MTEDSRTSTASLRAFIAEGCDARPEDRHHAIQKVDEIETNLTALRTQLAAVMVERDEAIERCAKVCDELAAPHRHSAGAPELLEALESIEEDADYGSVRDELFKDILRKARAALAKARHD